MGKVDFMLNGSRITALEVGVYSADGSLYLQLWTDEEPYATLTTCLCMPGKKKEHKNLAYLDMNNCPEASLVVEKLGLGHFAGKVKCSGFCSYPLYEFDIEKVESLAGF